MWFTHIMSGFAGEFLFRPGLVDMNAVRRMSQGFPYRGMGEHTAREGSTVRESGSPRGAASEYPARESPTARFGVVCWPSGGAFPGLAVSPDGLHVVALVGEIYNAKSLRQELVHNGATFRTSDHTASTSAMSNSRDHDNLSTAAELLLHLYRLHGCDMLHRLRGRFAVAFYDARLQTLLLARDPLGQKTLWYAWLDDRLVFASSGKILLRHLRLAKRTIRSGAIVEYMLLGYIPHPGTVYENIYKLPPGNELLCSDSPSSPRRYWRPALVELPALPQERVELVRHRIEQAVALCMEYTDKILTSGGTVSPGSLLSGGVDSAIMTALMVKQAGKTGGVRTFTAGFDDPRFDERADARRVAAHLGTQHTELLIEPAPVAMLDGVVARHDEPFGDSSAIPTFLICQAASQYVSAALAGDGGDEIFGGYDRYKAMMLAERMTPSKYMLVRLATFVARLIAPHDERSRLRRFVRFSNGLAKPFASQYFSYRALFQEEDIGRLFTPSFAEHVDLAATATWFNALYEGDDTTPAFDNEVARAQHHDLMTYLPDDLCVKSDISSMPNSLDLRAPFLDHELANIGLSFPVEQKISGTSVRNYRGKSVLRELFADYLPPGALCGVKKGFGVPIGSWLKHELSSQLRETLLDKRFLERGIFQPTAIHGLVNDHLSGRDDHRHRLWAMLVLAKWLDQND